MVYTCKKKNPHIGLKILMESPDLLTIAFEKILGKIINNDENGQILLGPKMKMEYVAHS